MKHCFHGLIGLLCLLGFQLLERDPTGECARRFDVVTFCSPCSPEDYFCQPQFDHLNWKSTPGRFLAIGGDAYRTTITNQNNELAAYYNNFTEGIGI